MCKWLAKAQGYFIHPIGDGGKQYACIIADSTNQLLQIALEVSGFGLDSLPEAFVKAQFKPHLLLCLVILCTD